MRCTPTSTISDCNTDPNCCLTKDEAACYSSYKLGQTRSALESNLQEIYHPETSTSNAFQSNLETTMLTGIVWAMLGTTVLYYAFTKI
jgi:hypothetical protein